MNWIMDTAIFVLVLALLLRSLVAPLYLVGSVLLSFGTTMGVATLLFQGVLGHDGFGADTEQVLHPFADEVAMPTVGAERQKLEHRQRHAVLIPAAT